MGVDESGLRAAEQTGHHLLALAVIDGRWSELTDRFTPEMSAQVERQGVVAVWRQVTGLVGPFRRLGDSTARSAGDLVVVDTPMHFEGGQLIGRISLQAGSDRIAGLYFLDPEEA